MDGHWIGSRFAHEFPESPYVCHEYVGSPEGRHFKHVPLLKLLYRWCEKYTVKQRDRQEQKWNLPSTMSSHNTTNAFYLQQKIFTCKQSYKFLNHTRAYLRKGRYAPANGLRRIASLAKAALQNNPLNWHATWFYVCTQEHCCIKEATRKSCRRKPTDHEKHRKSSDGSRTLWQYGEPRIRWAPHVDVRDHVSIKHKRASIMEECLYTVVQMNSVSCYNTRLLRYFLYINLKKYSVF